VLSAFILPLIQEYVSGLDSKLDELGLRRQLQLMQVNGGCASPEEIVRRPVYLLHSGPAAAPAAAGVYSKTLNVPNALVIDMGGTSLDICVAQDGRPRVSTSIRAGEHPIGVAGAEVLSIGAGGGSIGWLDSGGALRVGPRSAGAVPGPAAYGAGGTEPTVTDANVIAGYLSPDAFLGGRRRLDVAGARQAIATHVADPLGMSVEDAAAGILKVVNTNMVGAIRSVSVNRGVDPRTFTMIVGGGAGALHAVQMARALGMSRVVVPPQAGVLCSFGMTVTDVQHDYVAPYHGLTRSVDTEALAAVVGRLRDKARARLLEEGFDENSIRIEYGVDARYPGQIHDLPVALGPDIRFDADGIAEIERRFHQDHEREFAYSRPDVEVEFFHWRVKGIGLSGADTAFVLDDAVENLEEPQLRGTRDAYFEEAGGFVKTNIIDGSTLKPGMSFAGPAVIELPTTTIVVGPHDRSEILTDGTVSITVGAVARTGALPQV
jgi:N-methylhydantoinase A